MLRMATMPSENTFVLGPGISGRQQPLFLLLLLRVMGDPTNPAMTYPMMSL